jgi:hypothetical protein
MRECERERERCGGDRACLGRKSGRHLRDLFFQSFCFFDIYTYDSACEIWELRVGAAQPPIRMREVSGANCERRAVIMGIGRKPVYRTITCMRYKVHDNRLSTSCTVTE